VIIDGSSSETKATMILAQVDNWTTWPRAATDEAAAAHVAKSMLAQGTVGVGNAES